MSLFRSKRVVFGYDNIFNICLVSNLLPSKPLYNHLHTAPSPPQWVTTTVYTHTHSMAVLKSASTALILCTVMSAYVAEAGILCSHVTSSMSPCIPYGTGKVPTPPGECCREIKTLNNAAKTTTDRQTVCNCLKSLASAIPGIKYNVVEGLPGKCGVSIPYKIHPSTDCNRFGSSETLECLHVSYIYILLK